MKKSTRDEYVKRNMARLGIAMSNAWIRTIIDISRKPKIHSLIIIAIPPYVSWICDDVKEVCELFMYNVEEEMEALGFTPLIKKTDNRYIAEVYEKLRL